ncbi:MAG: hypothetical protein MZU95_04400 [Desulfomicrobium escambiense]|nr:hypothetical protein [Desulfomicrobium escambiense]
MADIAKELVDIADYSLKKMRNLNENNQDESVYLEKFKELIYQKQSPADVIIHNWNNGWNKDLSKLIEHVRLD